MDRKPQTVEAIRMDPRPHTSGAKQRHFLRRWRKFRDLTLEAVGAEAELSPSAISQVERFLTGYSEESLLTLARVYRCQPAELLWRDPLDPEAPWVIWDQLNDEQRRTGLKLLKALVTTDTQSEPPSPGPRRRSVVKTNGGERRRQ